jgi:hypothetical protein
MVHDFGPVTVNDVYGIFLFFLFAHIKPNPADPIPNPNLKEAGYRVPGTT